MSLARSLMHKYQNRCVTFIKNNLCAAIWMDMGLGKTVSTATAVSDLMEDFTVGRVLIVAPKRVALTTWPMELQSWAHLRHLRYSVIHGSERQRVQAVMVRCDIHIISRDNLSWLVKKVGAQWPWDCVVLDESSSFKSQSSNRFKALKRVRHLIDRVIELSATPAPQGLQDLWSQFYLLDKGHRLGASEKDFKARWFMVDRSGYGIVPKEHSEAEIHQKVSDITMHLQAEDYLDMPELIMNHIHVDMPAEVQARYKDFEKNMIMQLESMDLEIEADNAAVLTGKLLQFANGAVYTDESRNFELMHDEKVRALEEIIDTAAGNPVLVAYNFKSDLVRLKKAFPKAVVLDDDPETQRRWNAGKIPILLTHPASSGHGLNLQKGSNMIVWFGLPWSLEYYLQLIGRLYRQGQTSKTVVVNHIVSRNTVDERVVKVLTKKGVTQKNLLEAVKMLDE